jgi:hypothetical protein
MLKSTTLFLLGYSAMLCVVYIFARGDEFTPSRFEDWGLIATAVYIVLFILTLYFLKRKKSHEKPKL